MNVDGLGLEGSVNVADGLDRSYSVLSHLSIPEISDIATFSDNGWMCDSVASSGVLIQLHLTCTQRIICMQCTSKWVGGLL